MIRFIGDADFNLEIVRGCWRREPGLEFISSHVARLHGVPDPEVLAIAARESRVLLSHDCKSMPAHFGDFLQSGGSIPGLILVPQFLSIGEAVEELLLIWGASEAEEWKDRLIRLPL
ncbi:MAG: DUF5615 family PIN-like protein [Acidobacteriaceae bacterium]|nr:DUF5615 family PIN-like protein [Acidobacteriaceae bacterium]